MSVKPVWLYADSELQCKHVQSHEQTVRPGSRDRHACSAHTRTRLGRLVCQRASWAAHKPGNTQPTYARICFRQSFAEARFALLKHFFLCRKRNLRLQGLIMLKLLCYYNIIVCSNKTHIFNTTVHLQKITYLVLANKTSHDIFVERVCYTPFSGPLPLHQSYWRIWNKELAKNLYNLDYNLINRRWSVYARSNLF